MIKPIALGLALATLLAWPVAACIPDIPRHVVEFPLGSAELPEDQKRALVQVFDNAQLRTQLHLMRVSVRGFGDYRGAMDPSTWTPEDLALARARAQAMSDALTAIGIPCIERVAMGVAPSDAPPGDARPRRPGGVVAVVGKHIEDTPIEGVPVEGNCRPKPETPKA